MLLKYKYKYIKYEEIYSKKSSIYNLFKNLNINLIDNEKLDYYLKYDYNTNHKLKLVKNLDEVKNLNLII